jgi:hypothetical protein
MQVPSSAIVSPAQVLLLLVLYERFVHNAPNVHVFIEPGMMAVVGCAVCTDSHVELSSLNHENLCTRSLYEGTNSKKCTLSDPPTGIVRWLVEVQGNTMLHTS